MILGNKVENIFKISSNQEVAKYIEHTHQKLWKKLQEHSRKYYWMLNSYAETRYLDRVYFIGMIKEILAKKLTKEDIDRIFLQNDKRLVEYKSNIEKLENELNFTEAENDIIKLIDFFAFFQDERKAFSLRANHYTDLFMKEIVRRSGLSYDLVKFLSPYEYSELLADKFPLEKIKSRQKHMSLLFYQDGLKILEGDVSEKKEGEVFGGDVGGTTNEFEGMRAMGGKVIGKVRKILLVEDLKTMQAGEILVTTMTSPDFIMAMKKASAIVTDQGGVTCHAAVISRELGIPCVIGTKIATRVLKTGDVIEVRANHGIIKILKQG
jgi:phosphohistidine swiveling domain-containing protein